MIGYVVKVQELNSCWRWYQAEDDEEVMSIAIEKSREIVTVISLLSG